MDPLIRNEYACYFPPLTEAERIEDDVWNGRYSQHPIVFHCLRFWRSGRELTREQALCLAIVNLVDQNDRLTRQIFKLAGQPVPIVVQMPRPPLPMPPDQGDPIPESRGIFRRLRDWWMARFGRTG